MNKRRIVIRSIAAATLLPAVGMSLESYSQDTKQVTKLDPKDPQAVSLGYTDDTKTVDQKKYPKHTATQVCSGCQFYQAAQESKKIAPCTIFGGKGVAANGWCSAYAPKAA
jgi:hypothetical protein